MKKLLAFILAAMLCLTCFAACGKKNDNDGNNESTPTQVVYDVDDAAAYLKNMYKKYLTENETAADYTLVSQVMKGGVVYTITWTVDREDIKVIVDEENKQVKIDLDEQTKVDITYKLTATIADPDGKTATLTFDLKVPKYVLSSWEEYMAMEAGKAVVVQGYVAAVHAPSEGNKYNTLYLHDVNNKGGYYIYSMADSADLVKDLGIKVGMLVSVTGTKDIYSGTHEVKDAVVTILDSTVVDLAPLDITQTYKDAESLKDKSLTDKLGMLVTIKGVEITDEDLSEKSMYLNFKLSGLTSYLRVYATDCPASVTDKGQENIIAEHGKKKGYSADVTGVVVMYSGAIYLNPVSDTPFKYGKLIQRTDAEKVDVEIEDIIFEKNVALDKTIDLPSKGSSYEDVAITWVSNSDAIVIDGNKAKITLQSEATTATITGTFTLGTVIKTATYTFNLAKKSGVVAQVETNPVTGRAYKLFTLQENLGGCYYFTGAYSNDKNQYGQSSNNPNDAVDVMLEAATDNKYYLTMGTGANKKYITIVANVGTDSNTGADKTYINFNISDTKPATAFTFNTTYNTLVMPVEDPLSKETLDYYMGTYNTYDTFSASKLSYAATSFPSHLGTVVDTSTIAPADKVAAEKSGLTVEDEFFADAEIDLATKGSVYDDVVITWASNNAAAVVNGGKLTITLGDEEQTVTLTATLECGTVTDTKTFEIKLNAAGIKLTDIPTLNTIGAGQAANVLTSNKYYTMGKITEIQNTDYGNMYIEDEEGNKLYIYGLYIDGSKYGNATGTKPVVGDYIIIFGAMTSYNSNAQMKNADLIKNLGKYPVTDIPTLNTIGEGQASNVTTDDKYYATGTITSIANTTYGNMYIKDAEGNELYIYGLYIDGSKYGDAATKPVVGDTIVVNGAMTSYNSKAQMKNADLIEVNGTVIGGNEDDGDDDNQDGGSTTAGSVVATFKFGTDDSSKTNEANQDGTETASYTETSNGYTLSLTGMSKAYKDSFDAKGNACLKLGTSKAAGLFTFTVPADVTSVKIYVAGYKANTGKFTINGGSTQSTTKTSANGEYDVITIDTSSNKTIAFTTVSGGWRVKINTIEFCK